MKGALPKSAYLGWIWNFLYHIFWFADYEYDSENTPKFEFEDQNPKELVFETEFHFYFKSRWSEQKKKFNWKLWSIKKYTFYVKYVFSLKLLLSEKNEIFKNWGSPAAPVFHAFQPGVHSIALIMVANYILRRY